MAEKLCKLRKYGGGNINNIVGIANGYGHYYTYSNGFTEHNESIVKGAYIQNAYNRGVFNLKKSNISSMKIYNSEQSPNIVFLVVGIKNDGAIDMVYGGNAMTEVTKTISGYEYLICSNFVGQVRLRFD